MSIADVDRLPDFADITSRLSWIWKRRKCFQIVCSFLEIRDIVKLSLCSQSLLEIFRTNGFHYKSLLIYDQSQYHIPIKVSPHLVSLDPTSRKRTQQQHRQPSLSTAAQQESDASTISLVECEKEGDSFQKRGESIISPTEYSTHTGTFRKLTSAQKQRLHVDGTSSVFLGGDWFKCSKEHQRVWLSGVKQLEVLWVDVDISGDKGIEPWSLARLLENNQKTLKSIRIHWRYHPSSATLSWSTFYNVCWLKKPTVSNICARMPIYVHLEPDESVDSSLSRQGSLLLQKESFKGRSPSVSPIFFVRQELKGCTSDCTIDHSLRALPSAARHRVIHHENTGGLTTHFRCCQPSIYFSNTRHGTRPRRPHHQPCILTRRYNQHISELSSPAFNLRGASLPSSSDAAETSSINILQSLAPAAEEELEDSKVEEQLWKIYGSDKRNEKYKQRLRALLASRGKFIHNSTQQDRGCSILDVDSRYLDDDDEYTSVNKEASIIFPCATEVSIQLAHQHATKFFSGLQFPQCTKFLIEETRPVYGTTKPTEKSRAKPVIEKVEDTPTRVASSLSAQRRQTIIPGGESFSLRRDTVVAASSGANPAEFDIRPDNDGDSTQICTVEGMLSTSASSALLSSQLQYDGTHLLLWLDTLKSMRNLKEAHILVGNVAAGQVNKPLPKLTNALHILYRRVLKNNRQVLEVFSCRSPSIASEEILLLVAELNAFRYLADCQTIAKPIDTFLRLREINCESVPLILSDFALNVLLSFPHVKWKTKAVVVGTTDTHKPDSRQEKVYENKKFDKDWMKHHEVQPTIPDGFLRPSDAGYVAILERWLLRLLELDIERLILGPVTEDFAATFSRNQPISPRDTIRDSPSDDHNFASSIIFQQLDRESEDAINHQDISWDTWRKHDVKNWCSHDPGFVTSLIQMIPHEFINFALMESLIGQNAQFPSIIRLELFKTENVAISTLEKHFIRILRSCRLGTSGKFQNPNIRSKSRLQICAPDDFPVTVFAILPKFHLVLRRNTIRVLEIITNHPIARKQLRGLSGSLDSLIQGLNVINQKYLPWNRPMIKALEVALPHAVVRCFASLSHLLIPLASSRHVTELRVFPISMPQFLTPEELFGEASPEGGILREILRIESFHRDQVAEAEIRGLYGRSMFVFTRPEGRKSRWQKFSNIFTSKDEASGRQPEVDL